MKHLHGIWLLPKSEASWTLQHVSHVVLYFFAWNNPADDGRAGVLFVAPIHSPDHRLTGTWQHFKFPGHLLTRYTSEVVAGSHRAHKNVYRRSHEAPQFLMLSAEKEGKGQCPAWRNAHLLYSLRHQTRWLVTALSFSLLCRMQISWLLDYLSFGRGVAALRCSAGTPSR